jgi:hypothetical protein
VNRRVAIGIVTLALFGSACGGGAGEKTVRAGGSVGEPEPTTTTQASTTTMTAKKAPLTAAALQEALLTVEDLPPGYALSPPDEDDGDDTDDTYCDGADPAKAVPPALEQEIGFRKGPLGPFLSQSILQYTVADEAQRYMAEFRRILDNCSSYDRTGADGETSTVTVTKMSFGPVGDDTLAIKFTVQGASPFSGDTVLVRHDGIVLAVATMTLDGADTGDTIKAVVTAHEKLERIL